MNGSSHVVRRERGARLPIAQTAAAVAATALTLLAVACSSGHPSSAGPGGSSSTAGSADSRSAVGFSACMRSHGVPQYPDPDSNGTLPKPDPQAFGVSSSQFSAAQQTCQHLLPATGGSLTASSLQQCYLAFVCPQALVQQAVNAGRDFARCMRADGVPDWPDPTIDSHGRPLFNITVPRPTPPQINTAISECERVAHPGSLLAWG